MTSLKGPNPMGQQKKRKPKAVMGDVPQMHGWGQVGDVWRPPGFPDYPAGTTQGEHAKEESCPT